MSIFKLFFQERKKENQPICHQEKKDPYRSMLENVNNISFNCNFWERFLKKETLKFFSRDEWLIFLVEYEPNEPYGPYGPYGAGLT